MKAFTIQQLGGGVIRDKPPHALENNIWSYVNNIRMQNSQITNILGYVDQNIGGMGTPRYFITNADSNNYYYLFATNSDIYEWDGSNLTNRSKIGGYTGTDNNRWNGGVLHGVSILNNGFDNPQYALPGNDFAGLRWTGSTSWAVAGKGAQVIRPFKNFLLGLNITEGGTNYPDTIFWSDAAEIGAAPTDWDYTSATNLAGRMSFAETAGTIVDGAPLGQDFIIYKTDSIFALQFVGQPNIFAQRRLNIPTGLLTQGGIANLGDSHVFMAQGDIIQTNGQSWRSIADNRVKNEIFDNISADAYDKSFVVYNDAHQEVWVCYPDQDVSFPNRAAIWSIQDDNWSFIELPADTTHLAIAIDAVDAGATYDSVSYTYNTVTDTYNTRAYNPSIQSLHGLHAGTFSKFDYGNDFGSVVPVCTAERYGIKITGMLGTMNIHEVYPEIEGRGQADFYLASQGTTNGSVEWVGPYTFNPQTDYKIDTRVSTRLFGIKFIVSDGNAFKFSGYTVKYTEAGTR